VVSGEAGEAGERGEAATWPAEWGAAGSRFPLRGRREKNEGGGEERGVTGVGSTLSAGMHGDFFGGAGSLFSG
jgi:hypothetical protein